MAQRFAMWTLDEEDPVSIPGGINLEWTFFEIGSDLDVLCVLLKAQGIP